MKPAIDRIIEYLEAEVASYNYAGQLDYDFEVLDAALDKAKDIKKECEAEEIEQSKLKVMHDEASH